MSTDFIFRDRSITGDHFLLAPLQMDHFITDESDDVVTFEGTVEEFRKHPDHLHTRVSASNAAGEILAQAFFDIGSQPVLLTVTGGGKAEFDQHLRPELEKLYGPMLNEHEDSTYKEFEAVMEAEDPENEED